MDIQIKILTLLLQAFPRVTMCDIFVRRLGNVQRYTMQCVLPINLFNEAVFLIIWFWFVFVAFATAWSMLSWAARCSFRIDRHRYVRKHLGLLTRRAGQPEPETEDDGNESDDSEDSIDKIKKGIKMQSKPKEKYNPYNWDKIQFIRFVDDYLRPDGVFVLRLIQHNTNSLTVDEFTAKLWDFYQKEVAPKDTPIYTPTTH